MDLQHVAADRELALASAPSAVRPAGAAVQTTWWTVTLFTTTLFLSAFLLFLVQPMVAKMVLPLLGGAPMVWNTCMVFFQVALLAGYAYAHAAARWAPPRLQIALHVAVLAVAMAALPFAIDRQILRPPETAPVGWLLLLLAGTIGLPFFALSTSASVFQHWFSRTDHPAAADPYFLYVASNVGSFAALIAYPAIVEPGLSVGAQTRVWALAYATFIALAALCGAATWRRTAAAPRVRAEARSAPPLPLARRARWVALAFVPSSLMLATTTYVSTDIAAVPLLWIVPLSLYLLTFVAAFSAKGPGLRRVARAAFPVVLMPVALALAARLQMPMALSLPLNVLAFVCAALLCHVELSVDRPEAVHLTEFYLWLSFGGMLGGLFNALAAPLLFSSVAEYPIVLTAACVLMPAAGRGSAHGERRRTAALNAAVALAVGASALAAVRWPGASPAARLAALCVPAAIAFAARRRPARFGLAVGALLFAGIVLGRDARHIVHAERTFFGIYRIETDRSGRYVALAHGTTLHGMEATSGPEHGEPLTYFHRGGPVGQAFAALPAARSAHDVGVIGLGIGTLAAYARPGQDWTFYEIDPAVERMARDSRYFDFLDRCGDQCRVVLGDARLALGRDPAARYDLFVLDAFSSDSIPMHLLTSEALGLYLSRLRPGGAILFHISNGHLSLAPIVARLAREHGLAGVSQLDRRAPDWPASRSESHWVALARQPGDLGSLAADSRWTPLSAARSAPLWTDDFSNILSALR